MLFVINNSIKSAPLHSIKTWLLHTELCITVSALSSLYRGWTRQVKQRHGGAKGHRTVGQSGSGNTTARATVFGCPTQGLILQPTEPLRHPTKHNWNPPQMPVSCICREQCSTEQMLFLCRIASEKIMWSLNITQKHPLLPRAGTKGTSSWIPWAGKLLHT